MATQKTLTSTLRQLAIKSNQVASFSFPTKASIVALPRKQFEVQRYQVCLTIGSKTLEIMQGDLGEVERFFQ